MTGESVSKYYEYKTAPSPHEAGSVPEQYQKGIERLGKIEKSIGDALEKMGRKRGTFEGNVETALPLNLLEKKAAEFKKRIEEYRREAGVGKKL